MSKPLVLTIHPRLEDTNLSFDDIHQGRWTELRLRNRKRLTDPELAAEVFSAVFHESECEVRARQLGEGHPAFNHWLKANHEYARQAEIVERFATLPHASDNDYQ